MANETTITIIGNLTDDVSLRFSPAGAAVANFTVASTPRTFNKASNEWEDGDTLSAEAEVPGISMDGLDITVVGSQLTVGGRRQPIEGEGVCCHRQERGAGDFKRTIELPVDVDGDRVEATLKNGVLSIQLPKAAPARARKIVVKSK